jgi:pimeloyl-ACP methyl ester carboxylesterase
MSALTIKNKKIHYRESGTGIPVVLLHGYLESLEIWNGFATKLAENFHVITIDLSGHGKSESLGEINRMEEIAEAVHALTRKLGMSKFILIGHSLGGYVVMAFLELFPEKLLGFSLFHSHPLADTPETQEKRRREIELIRQNKKELICNVNIPNAFATKNLKSLKEKVDFATQIALGTPDDGLISTLKGMMERPDRTRLLKNTKLPFLWILGRLDNYIPVEGIQQKVKLPENGSLVILENSGHQGFLEEEARSLEIFDEFISRYLK